MQARRIILVDENEIVREAMKEYLEKALGSPVQSLRSPSEIDEGPYDTIFLNLSSCRDCQRLVEGIRKVQGYDFKRLVVFSDLCPFQDNMKSEDNRVVVLCKRGVGSVAIRRAERDLFEVECARDCDWFQFKKTNATTLHGPGIESLSSREIEVLELIGRGFSSRQIAAHLFISKRTVDHHRENISRKLNLSGVSQILMFAIGFLKSIGG